MTSAVWRIGVIEEETLGLRGAPTANHKRSPSKGCGWQGGGVQVFAGRQGRGRLIWHRDPWQLQQRTLRVAAEEVRFQVADGKTEPRK